MEKLKFYNIEEKYIEFLYKIDKKVPYNKNNKRPYIGVVLHINEIKYYAPMFSPKLCHNNYKANISFVKIGENLGIIKLNNMIPVSERNLKYIDISLISDEKYRNLLIKQNNYIQKNSDKIQNTAQKLYITVTVKKKDFFMDLCCDFKKLESCYKYYNRK